MEGKNYPVFLGLYQISEQNQYMYCPAAHVTVLLNLMRLSFHGKE